MAHGTDDATAERGRVHTVEQNPPSDTTLLLHVEYLDIKKRRTSEQVIVRSETLSRDVAVEEALKIEQVVVEHVYVGRFVEEMPPTRQEGDTIIVPIVEEVAVVVKRLFLRNEVHVRKVHSTAAHAETVTLREQQAVITRTEQALEPVVGTADPNPSHVTLRSMTMEHEETIVAVYDTPAHAELAINDLRAANVPEAAISSHAGQYSADATRSAPVREKGFWTTLFGGETYDDEHVYEQSAQGGSSIVAVRTPVRDIDSVVEILERHNPVNLDERAASYGASTGTMTSGTAPTPAMTGYDPSTSAAATSPVASGYADKALSAGMAGDTVQLSEERLAIGKRLVNRGGTRLRRYVVETPVQEDVSLHTETVQIDRRPVTGGTITSPDFSEKTIEMTATSEEAVIGKTAHVVEEVSLRKEATDHVETIHDTVRKEEVEIEQIAGDAKVATDIGTTPLNARAPKI